MINSCCFCKVKPLWPFFLGSGLDQRFNKERRKHLIRKNCEYNRLNLIIKNEKNKEVASLNITRKKPNLSCVPTEY